MEGVIDDAADAENEDETWKTTNIESIFFPIVGA